MKLRPRTYLFGAAACALFVGGCTAILGLERKSLSDAGSPDGAADAEDPAKRYRVFYYLPKDQTRGGLINNDITAVAYKADTVCYDAADQAQLGLANRTWVAWISIPALAMKDRLKNVSVPRYLVDQTTRVFSGSPFTQLPSHPIDMNVLGQSLSAGDGGGPLPIFTGTTVTGDLGASHCEGWTTNDAGAFGVVGSTASTGADWTAKEQPLSCNTLGGFYCFEDDGPRPTTPAGTVTGKSQSPPPLRAH